MTFQSQLRIPGPTPLPERVLRSMQRPMIDHRGPEFAAILAEIVAQYTRKGALVFVEGRIQTRSWEGQDGQKRRTTEIIANDVQFLDSRSGGGGGPADGAPRSRPAQTDDVPAPDDAPRDVDPDEIPF